MSSHEHELRALAGLFAVTGRLKRLKRQGWMDRGVEQPESVSDHSFRLALMALVLGARDPGIDAERAVRLALVHDLPEALTGDITPFDDREFDSDAARDALYHELPEYSPEADQAKTAAERQAMGELTVGLPENLRRMLIDAWEEYEAGESPEARFVRQLDKLETWLQALEYRQIQPDLIIESFRKGTGRDVTDAELRRLRQAIDLIFDAS